MARRVFYSFHYIPDGWRASQVRNMGVIEGNSPVSDNDWESVTRGGDSAIERWITNQLNGTSCSIVLIGAATAGRKWINYEITSSWNKGNGVLGIHIHRLKDRNESVSQKGTNPFSGFTIGSNKTPMTSIVETYDPPGASSTDVYRSIKENLSTWVERAIEIRSRH